MAKSAQDSSRFKEFRNAKAHRNYLIEDTLEAGIMLRGTEVKSLRAGKAQLTDSFARIEKGEVILYHFHISEYSHGNLNNHNPTRPRKLLLHAREIRKLQEAVDQKGAVLVPLKVYFKNGLAKVALGVGKGKKLFDKRRDIQDRAAERDIARAMKDSLQRSG